jgi:preprotein translocase subunit SecE
VVGYPHRDADGCRFQPGTGADTESGARQGIQAPEGPDNQVMRTVSSTSSTKKRRGSPALFIRQVIAELRKVVRPTRNELITYTSVVLVFVMVVMLYVSLLDFGFGKLVLWAFGGA